MNNIYWYLRRFLIDFIKINQLKKYYNKENRLLNVNKKTIIYMADGKMLHGGLSDRLCGLVSAYACSKDLGVDFKVFFESPYLLTDYLIPNKVNWVIKKEEISFNSDEAIPIYLPNYEYRLGIDFQKKITKEKLNINSNQIHLYTNMRYFTKLEFNVLFNELFQLTEPLKNKINYNSQFLPDKYISITFRFQQLLGDFEEGDFEKLKTEDEKKQLINKCISKIKEIKKENSQYHKILITSDSKIFLDCANQLDYVYIIPGDIVHMDFVQNKDLFDEHLKSFVDFFMLANADKIYLVNFHPLYSSSFPQTASFINNKEFIELC